ncbi:MAG: excinuclease ABC subunit UvrA, partial [Candidatus Levybacteria bacterium]|nr:excinuclease ABC subunit UvrA [Candidatus Levybacteria bacterium]
MNDKIVIKGAREHNLKNIDLEIPKNKLVVFTGLSGSGKSSLAFDTIYAEGQRRYVESLSSYARQFLGIMRKPDVDLIEGLSPAISIDQKSTSRNPRSTVGTVTEIYDYMRLLWARLGRPHCPNCKREITRQTNEQITKAVLDMLPSNSSRLKLLILSPVVKDRKGEYSQLFLDIKKRGYTKVRIDGEIYTLLENFVLIKTNKHTIEAVIDELILSKDTDRNRLTSAVEQALRLGEGEIIVSVIKDAGFSIPQKPKKMEDKFFSEKLACPVCNISIKEVEPRFFSFNTPHGACTTCNGIGNILNVDRDLIINKNLTILEGALLPFYNLLTHDTWFSRTFRKFCEENNIPLDKRLNEVPKDKIKILLEGTGNKEYEVKGGNRWGRDTVIYEPFGGLILEIKRKYELSESIFLKSQLEKFMRLKKCDGCQGSRLKQEALSVTISGKSIVDVSNMPINESLGFIENLTNSLPAKDMEVGNIILKEIKYRLSFLIDVGLNYLTLSRGAETLDPRARVRAGPGPAQPRLPRLPRHQRPA